MVARQARRQKNYNPRKIEKQNYNFVSTVNILDLYKNDFKQKSETKWTGGDKEDRLEYIQKKKAELNLAGVLDKTSARMVDGTRQKENTSFLEFNEVSRFMHIRGSLQPHEMQWSIEEYMKGIEGASKKADDRLVKKIINAEAKSKQVINAKKLPRNKYEEENFVYEMIEGADMESASKGDVVAKMKSKYRKQ